ncbi:hypothetical protein AMAG_00850 [Allomyces macrogynus ATCC 38327]|uniref:Glutathione S-transferase n=1 Tax=Allomyces macrogynus (strain ATCC 38327) TaxID=578462 RepID=A0A0L0RXX4_ALLM3|nr:hypothetical protein AMAG_00850 [Allomyces macrogynus ATCC 38327]|eukprot:KNE54906.1 hypothetical protein AMAG_00850 [Allomyces macrogynus ATCC 38327]
MASPKYVVWYYPGKGRAENARLILEAAGVPYENKYIGDWAAEKPTTPFGQLPVLLMTNEKTNQPMQLAQSAAIVRFLARKYDLVAEDPLDYAIADSVYESTNDINELLMRIVWATPEPEKPAAIEKFKQETVPNFIKSHTAILEKNGNKGIYAGNELTYVELAAFNTINELNAVVPGAISATTAPALWKMHELVANHDKIKAYLASPRLHKV